MKRALWVSLIFLFWQPSAFAVLGEKRVGIKALSAVRSQDSKATLNYDTNVVDGVEIHEYVDAAGLVYAVTWSGKKPPNLTTLLGRYFSEYKVSTLTTPRHQPRRSLASTSDNLEVHQFGLPNQVRGIIYLRNRLPSNVSPEDLQ